MSTNILKSRFLWPVFFASGTFGAFDAFYLTWEHFKGVVPPCTIDGCEQVLTSEYATLLTVPISLFGFLFYLTALVIAAWYIKRSSTKKLFLLLVLTTSGLFVSFLLIYVQLFVLEAICLYCMFSAFSTFLLWTISFVVYFLDKRDLQNRISF